MTKKVKFLKRTTLKVSGVVPITFEPGSIADVEDCYIEQGVKDGSFELVKDERKTADVVDVETPEKPKRRRR